MRIAVSGAHRVGKSTLIEALSSELASYRVVDEPYWILEEEGHDFSDPPTIEDFEAQLRRSFALIADAPANAVFDRCPLDFVAYLRALDDEYELEPWLDALRDAIEKIDVVAFVAIESPDRIVVSTSEDRRLRARVDEQLRSIMLDDVLGLDIDAIEVVGAVEQRAREVLRLVRAP